MLEPCTLPPRLVVRALDDLHTLARFASFVMERYDDTEALLAEVAGMAGRVEELGVRAAEVQVLIARVDRRAKGVLDVASRIEAEVPALDRVLASVDLLGAAAATLAQTVEPLQGVTERLARVAERLPGGVRVRPRSQPAPGG